MCEARDWTPEETIAQLEINWARFTQPTEERLKGVKEKKSAKQRKREKNKKDLYVSDDEAE